MKRWRSVCDMTIALSDTTADHGSTRREPYRAKPLDAWTKSVGDRITRDASTAKVDQVFGSDFDHLPL
jgi:hypothetical protein